MKAQLLALGAVLVTHLVAAETPDVEAQGFPGFPDFPKIPFPGDWYNKFRQVTPEKLIWHIGIKDLMAGAKKLEGIAYATPERNRVFGTKAHNDTVDYLVRELQRTHYYDVVKQQQIHLWSMSNATFKVNGKDTEVTPMTYSPSGQSKADIVLVNNLGCVARKKERKGAVFNVIATSKDGDKNNIIAIGGHTDSVEAGPGINDDGSGIIGNLIIAKALARFKVPNAVRFLFWTAEEYGLLGSQYYVDNLTPQERDKIRLYLNFDMTASPNYANMIYDGDGSTFNVTGPAGSAEIENLFQKYYEDRKQPHIPTEFDGRSDYDAFISVGIPSGGIFTGAEVIKTEEQAKMFGGTAGIAYDANYHGKGDNVTNINKDAWLLNTKGAAYVLATYARSTKGLPPKDPPPKDENQARSLGRYRGVKAFNGRCDDVHGHGRRCTY
ncbi:aminopeptidase [Histoplasma capsulatum H143]|uniref:Peptide hydrolase n=1 Tax=Ajellomyces capsulatus (strain H143) TaxID=544712 RepID=C6H4B2_AJECH|nr:aminopeptidase [Histoplasma capsulatum H143]